MNRTEKEQLVAELKEKIQGASALYYTDFTGLNVKRMTELRRTLRKAKVEYVVIKNTLALRAVNTSINTLTISSEGHTQPGCSSLLGCVVPDPCQIGQAVAGNSGE